MHLCNLTVDHEGNTIHFTSVTRIISYHIILFMFPNRVEAVFLKGWNRHMCCGALCTQHYYPLEIKWLM